MKQFKLREQKSFIKILKEPPLEKKKTNWSRRVYLAIFLVALFLLLKRVYNANMLIQGFGQIELPKQTITFPNDIKLTAIMVNKGSEICVGDTLFAYKTIADPNNISLIQMESGTPDWLIKDELSTRKRIELNGLMISQKSAMCEIVRSRKSKSENLLLAGIHEAYDQYENLKSTILRLENEIDFLEKENKLLKKNLRSIAYQKGLFESIQQVEQGIYEQQHYFTATVDGVISDIFFNVNEICYKKAEMLTIHQLMDPTIHAYFDPESIDHLNVGDLVDIEFPGQSKTKGIIEKFYVSTYALPSEFQKKYEPTERNIVAKINPVDEPDMKRLKTFYKMDVKISKHTIPISF